MLFIIIITIKKSFFQFYLLLKTHYPNSDHASFLCDILSNHFLFLILFSILQAYFLYIFFLLLLGLTIFLEEEYKVEIFIYCIIDPIQNCQTRSSFLKQHNFHQDAALELFREVIQLVI